MKEQSRRILIRVIISLCFVLTIYSNFGPDGFARKMLSGFIQRPFQPIFPTDTKFDELIGSLSQEGNLFIKFQGFNPDDHGGYMQRIYYRGNYVSFPKRVYVSGENNVIKNAQDLYRSNKLPTAQLLVNLGIENWMLLDLDASKGKVTSKIHKVR